jgi:acyl carrier protein
VLIGDELMNEIELRRIFADVFSLDAGSVAPDMSPDTVDEWDSFGHMRLVTAVEAKLGIHLRMDQVLKIDSFEALRQTVAEARPE